MISFTCSGCGKSLSVKDEFAGKRGNCPRCKQPVLVPAKRMTGVPQAAALQTSPGVPAQPAAPRRLALEATVDQPANTLSSADVQAPKLDFLAKPQTADELGRMGQYRVQKVLGAGGMGLVLLADDPVLKRSVALKVMRPEVAADQIARQRFLREAQATAAIDHHHIVHILQVGEENGVPFIVMPLLKGEPLDARLKRENQLPVADAVIIGKQIAEGLAVAHQHGLIHRDIKPANLWLSGEPGAPAAGVTIKIVDFGLARGGADDVQLTKSGAILGTPAYMAPEQAKSQKVDFRCDLFSLGAVMYRMLTGELPFKGEDTMSMLMALATETPKPVRQLNPEVPPPLEKLVLQLLTKDPAKRPASAKAAAEMLGEMAGEQTVMLASGGRKPPVEPQTGSLRPPPVMRLLKRVVAFVWSLRPWAFRRPGLAFGVETVVFLLLVLPILLPFASRKKEIPTDPKSGDREGAENKAPRKEFVNSLGIQFVLVPKGKSWLDGGNGNPGTETEIKSGFYLGKYEVTQEEWQKVTGLNPSNFKGVPEITNRLPVESVSWEDCQSFITRLNGRVKEAGWVYRLPKEVEWEYACRGGPMADRLEGGFDFYSGKPAQTLFPDAANFNFDDKALRRTCKVGSYPPNRLGLYDMHGNVWEWCDDELKDDKGAAQRVNRGGGWIDDSRGCRAASRYTLAPSLRSYYLGLRLARVPANLASK